MSEKLANAYPRKHFFLEMFTRDISLEDCILDLIDNAIDGLVRTRNINISAALLQRPTDTGKAPKEELPRINIVYSATHFEISDRCGGIPRDHAMKDVFNFGHAPDALGGVLGVYGIGLKRAIFKLGEVFDMESQTTTQGFTVHLNVKQWSAKDETLNDWRIPLTFTEGATSLNKSGTTITITKRRPEVVMRINDGVLEQRLRSIISRTYALFLGRFVVVTLNKVEIAPFEIPIGKSDEVEPGHDLFEDDGVMPQPRQCYGPSLDVYDFV